MFFRFFILLSILTAPAFAFAADFVVTLHTPVNEIRQKISSAILEEPDFNLWAINQDSSTENIVVVMSEKSFASIAIYP